MHIHRYVEDKTMQYIYLDFHLGATGFCSTNSLHILPVKLCGYS